MKAEGSRQKAEGRRQEAGGRRQKAESRRRKAEGSRQRAEEIWNTKIAKGLDRETHERTRKSRKGVSTDGKTDKRMEACGQ